ncbi:MAG: glycosyltransferase family 2 protein [Acholeplasmatales bacterium]|nr:glycosyltransferase family 2 protein [Acholeplasmatales bacterium]
MLLDIIIPQYSEDDLTIKPLLDSINNQVNVDFSNVKITIVNDCSNVLLSDDFLKGYDKLNISYIRNDFNTGPGLARQKGIDNTNCDFIMFCDSDDTLYDDKVLMIIMDFISKNEPDYLVTNIMIEGENGRIVKKDRSTFPWMHGKVYKREFLIRNEIRFHPKVRHLEDSYFTMSVLGCIDPKSIIYLDYVTYLWKNNSQSLTRKRKKFSYTVETFDDFYNSPIYTYEFLVKKNSYLKFNYLISSILAIYIVLYSNLFDYSELEEKKDYYIKTLKEYVKRKKNIFVIYGKEKVEKIYEIEYKELEERNGVNKVSHGLDYFYEEFLNLKY